jgi:hypothetical protein
MEAVAAGGLSPLEFLLGVMRDPQAAPELRLEAAKSAAPFVHPRLAAVNVYAEIDEQHDSEARRVLLDRLVGLIDQRPTYEIEGAGVVEGRTVSQLR